MAAAHIIWVSLGPAVQDVWPARLVKFHEIVEVHQVLWSLRHTFESATLKAGEEGRRTTLLQGKRGLPMADTARLLVLYHSSYGHTETLAYAVAHGVRAVEGVHVSVKRVPELMPEEVMRAAGMKVDQLAPVAEPQELVDYDGIIFGTPTRFGNMTSQMRNFLDQTGPLWVGGALIGKIGSVFTSTSTGGGNETTIISFHWTLLH